MTSTVGRPASSNPAGIMRETAKRPERSARPVITACVSSRAIRSAVDASPNWKLSSSRVSSAATPRDAATVP
ncbi:MAG: hypothetical protein GC172_06515 [Phycisphaera sp.]|nr:hypothetical protein [Phycisphaera sp.]